MRLDELLEKSDRHEMTFDVSSSASSELLVRVLDLLSFAVNTDPHLHWVACWLLKSFAFGCDYVLIISSAYPVLNGF